MKLELYMIMLVSSTGGSIRFRVKSFVNFDSITLNLFTLRIVRLNHFLDNHIVVLFTFLQCMI